MLRHDLEYERWKLQTLEDWRWNPLLYTRLAGDALYNLIAREFAPPARAPAQSRQAPRRAAAFPLAGARVAGPGRVPKIHAETAAKQNAGLISMLDGEVASARGNLARRGPGGVARQHGARAQRAVAAPDLAGEAAGARGARRVPARRSSCTTPKLGYALFSPLSRQEIRARAAVGTRQPRATPCTRSRARCSRAGAARRRCPKNPATRSASSVIRAALELANAERPARDAVLDAARAALADTTEFVREKNLVSLPDEPLEIIEMPAFKQGVALAYCDSPGPARSAARRLSTRCRRSRRPGRARRPIPSCANTTRARSAISPFTKRCRATTCSSRMPTTIRRRCARCWAPSPFIEGWAVYAERLMIDAGLPRRRSADAPGAAQVVPALHRQRAARPGGARRRHLARRGHETPDRDAASRKSAKRPASGRARNSPRRNYRCTSSARRNTSRCAPRPSSAPARRSTCGSTTTRLLSFGSPPVRFARQLLFDLPVECS